MRLLSRAVLKSIEGPYDDTDDVVDASAHFISESGVPLYVANAPHTHGSVTVDDIIANVLPGIDRALKSARFTKITGHDLTGQPQTATVRVCEAGPFLAMKLRAFARRQAPKDAFDILYTLLHYDRGTNVANGLVARREDDAVWPQWRACFN